MPFAGSYGAIDFQGENELSRNALAAVEESLESQRQQKERLSTLVQWNTPLVRAWYLKEAFQLFWTYKQPWRAQQHLNKWIRSAMRSKLDASRNRADAAEPSRRDTPVDQDSSFQRRGRRNEQQDQVNQPSLVRIPDSENFIAAIYHCCARLPLPSSANYTFRTGTLNFPALLGPPPQPC